MTVSRLRIPVIALALCATAINAHAHETWLMPNDTQPKADATLTWSLASGMAFGSPGSAITRDRITVAKLYHGGGAVGLLEVTSVDEGATTLVSAVHPGIQCAEIVLKPRKLVLPPDKIQPYFEEIGATPAIREAWAASKTPELWRETYTKYAKAIVRSSGEGTGASTAEGCWADRLAHPLEFVPERDPTSGKPGDKITLRVLAAGTAIAGQAVGLAHENGTYLPLKRADEQGRVSFTLDAPGRYMVYATRLMRSTADDEDWTSDFATLVFAVPEA